MSLQVTNYNDEWHVEVNLLKFFSSSQKFTQNDYIFQYLVQSVFT